jgi:hypothetical protein
MPLEIPTPVAAQKPELNGAFIYLLLAAVMEYRRDSAKPVAVSRKPICYPSKDEPRLGSPLIFPSPDPAAKFYSEKKQGDTERTDRTDSP